jgi:hypothetical protein
MKANQNASCDYRLFVIIAVDTDRAVQPWPTPMQMITSSPNRWYDLSPDRPPRQHEEAVPTTTVVTRTITLPTRNNLILRRNRYNTLSGSTLTLTIYQHLILTINQGICVNLCHPSLLLVHAAPGCRYACVLKAHHR